MNNISQRFVEFFSSIRNVLILLLLISFCSIFNQDGALNADGVGYLEQATFFVEGDFKGGFDFYPWPFFSLILAFLHLITNIHLQILGHFLCLFLFAISVFYYLKILNLLSKNPKINFYGGLVLASSIPIMDDYVSMILRDHGLWASCMAGTFYFLKYCNEKKYKFSLSWQFSFFVGSLFRPEAIFFIFLLPIWNFLNSQKHSLKNIFTDCLLLVIASLSFVLSIFIFDNTSDIITSSRISDLVYRPIQILNRIFQPLPILSTDPSFEILLNKNIGIISIAISLLIVFVKWCKSLGLFHGLLFIFSLNSSMKNRLDFQFNYFKHLVFFLLVSFFIVSINIYFVYVLSNRYWGFHLWWIYILVTPTLMFIIEHDRTLRTFKYFLLLFSSVLILNSLIDSKVNYELEVARYIRQNDLKNIDFGENRRISYYTFYDLYNFKTYSNEKFYLYRVINTKLNPTYDLNNAKNIVAKFPENKPKFVLVKNAE
jgi:hypothetical protein